MTQGKKEVSYPFESYRDRQILFRETRLVRDWWIKVYTITLNSKFESTETCSTVLERLDRFVLEGPGHSGLPSHHHAFLIIHEAREGVWILFSWWTGGEMLQTEGYFSSYEAPTKIERSNHVGSLVCVWELAVFIHERSAWIRHILSTAGRPRFESYRSDVFHAA